MRKGFAAYQRKWRKKNSAHVAVYNKAWRANPKRREYERLHQRDRRARCKRECIDAYGGKCKCCGETEIRFLTIDHKDGKGARHRRRLKLPVAKTGYAFYKWLKDHGYPKRNLQVLCFNCNCGRHYNGGICPHKEAA